MSVIGNTGAILLIMGFFLPVIFCIGNLHTRQSLFNEQARRLQEAFEKVCRSVTGRLMRSNTSWWPRYPR